jgi:hypothetical protein
MGKYSIETEQNVAAIWLKQAVVRMLIYEPEGCSTVSEFGLLRQ